MPQGSIFSPILFNIYIKDANTYLHSEVRILQYADDIVIFCFNKDIKLAFSYINSSLNNLYHYLYSRGLELFPSKSRGIIFSKNKSPNPQSHKILLLGKNISLADNVKFLGIYFDSKLQGRKHLEYLANKGKKLSNIITASSGTRWGAHPAILLTLYKSIFRSSIEYGSLIFQLKKQQQIFL